MKGFISSIFFMAIFSMFLTFIIYVDEFNEVLRKSERALSNLRFIEDYYAYCSIKFKKDFPLTLKQDYIVFTNKSFNVGCNFTVHDNVILLNRTYFIKFGEYFSTNISSSFYKITIDDYFNISCFKLPGSYKIIINSLNGTEFNESISYLSCVINGTRGNIRILFSTLSSEEINGTSFLVSPYLRVENPSGINFNIRVDKNLDEYEKEILWMLKIEKEPYYYRGYVKWR